MKVGWLEYEFEKCLNTFPRYNKISKKDFLTMGNFPIVSQEKNLINGYWNSEDDVIKITKPVIIFGDHTKIVKYIDFNFVVGADGVKVFEPIDKIDSRYFVYAINNLKLDDLGYARHYRVLKQSKIPVPPLSEQLQIVEKLDTAFDLIDRAKANIEKNIQNAKELFQSKLNQVFSDGKDKIRTKTWCQMFLNEISINLDSKRVPITKSHRVPGTIPYYGASGIVDYVKDYIFEGTFLLVSEDGANLVMRTYPIAFTAEGKSWVNNHAHILQFKNTCTHKFVEYYLNSIKLNAFISGMAQPKLNQAMLNKIPIYLPVSLDDQQKIVAQLDQLSTQTILLQQKYQQKLTNLEELKKSILEKAFKGELA